MRIVIFLIAFVLFACLSKPCPAQNNYGAFGQKISVKQYAGKEIVLQAAAKVDQIEKAAVAVLFFQVQKENKKPGKFLYSPTQISASQWATYTLSGRLDKDADSLSFGAFFQGRGNFSFDKFSITIDNQPVAIVDYNFETYKSFPSVAWSSPVLPDGYTISLDGENAFEGSRSLLVNGSGLKKLNKYGDNDSVGRFADVNGVKLYYEIYGTGEPLILLHGNLQSIEAFTNQIPEFSKLYKVIAIDTRGQGKSSTNADTLMICLLKM